MNKMVANIPLTVTLPNDDVAQSSHIAKLDLPQLPSAGREAHIVPGLALHCIPFFGVSRETM